MCCPPSPPQVPQAKLQPFECFVLLFAQAGMQASAQRSNSRSLLLSRFLFLLVELCVRPPCPTLQHSCCRPRSSRWGSRSRSRCPRIRGSSASGSTFRGSPCRRPGRCVAASRRSTATSFGADPGCPCGRGYRSTSGCKPRFGRFFGSWRSDPVRFPESA